MSPADLSMFMIKSRCGLTEVGDGVGDDVAHGPLLAQVGESHCLEKSAARNSAKSARGSAARSGDSLTCPTCGFQSWWLTDGGEGVVVKDSSYSIGVRYPSAEWRRWRL